MNNRVINKKIKNRKATLNFLLLFLKRTNPVVVLLSQNLDYYIYEQQKLIYKKHINNEKTKKSKKQDVA